MHIQNEHAKTELNKRKMHAQIAGKDTFQIRVLSEIRMQSISNTVYDGRGSHG